jgi:uncharacterized protein YllA (UPF0747 family)
MKKIKSIKQLKAEKKRVKQRQAELEGKIRSNWRELKENLKPVNIAKDTISRVMKMRAEDNLYGDGFVRNAITYGVTILANKFLTKAGSRLAKAFKKDTQTEN